MPTKVKNGLLILLISLFAMVANEHFDSGDLFNPASVLATSRHAGFGGFVYLLSYAAFLGSIVGLVIRFFRGDLVNRRTK